MRQGVSKVLSKLIIELKIREGILCSTESLVI